eukprot:XP_015584353.1 uncharacterized protein LOC8273299 [Ricinus communis]
MQPTFGNLESQRIYQDWRDNPRWHRVTRPYRAEDVIRLRSSRSPVQGEKAVAQGLWSTLTNGASTDSVRQLYMEEALIPAHSDDLAKTFANAQRLIAAGHAAAVVDADAVAAQPVPHLVAARLATDVHDTPLVLMARIKAASGDAALAYACAPYADVIWYEASSFDPAAAKRFIDTVRRLYPRQLVAYSCPASAVPDNSDWQDELREHGFCDVIASQPRQRLADAATAARLHRDFGSEIDQLIAHSLERGASRDFSGETFCEETAEKDLV